MAEITRTPNLGLGLQLNKKDYVSWDTITDNWEIIDRNARVGGGTQDTLYRSMGEPLTVGRQINLQEVE